MNPSQKKATDYPLVYLQNLVYPTLNQALTQLVEYVLTTNEINDHQERLKQQRIRNKAEQKRHNKERLKEELGSEYESSDEDSSFKLDFNAEEKEVIQGGEEALSDDASQTIQELANNTNEQKIQPQTIAQQFQQQLDKEEMFDKSLNPIKEDEEEAGSYDKESAFESQRTNLKFNPVQFLAAALKEINLQNKQENNS